VFIKILCFIFFFRSIVSNKEKKSDIKSDRTIQGVFLVRHLRRRYQNYQKYIEQNFKTRALVVCLQMDFRLKIIKDYTDTSPIFKSNSTLLTAKQHREVNNKILSQRFCTITEKQSRLVFPTSKQHRENNMGPLWCSNPCCTTGNLLLIYNSWKFQIYRCKKKG